MPPGVRPLPPASAETNLSVFEPSGAKVHNGEARGTWPKGRLIRMLAELRQHHEKIGNLLTELEVLCEDHHADIVKVSAVRIELTRASRARSAYLHSVVYPKLMRTCPPDKRIALEKLKSDGVLMLVRSGDHIRRWTTREITANWPGYCRASAAARQTMRDRIALEAQIIYPLLKAEGPSDLPRT